MKPAEKLRSSPRQFVNRHLFFKLAALSLPVLCLIGFGILLRLFGSGYPTTFFIPTPDGKAVMPNVHFGWQFFPPETSTYPYPCVLPMEKPPGTVRIFVLGESAAQGTPDPSFGFARILELLLREQFPDRKFEVVNAAMRGVDSHIVRLIAADCARYQPDLFLIYMGNNESIGHHSPDPGSSRIALPGSILRAMQCAKSTRLGQWLSSRFRKAGGKTQDMELFRKARLAADDPRRERIYKYFGENLESMIESASGKKAKVLLATVAVNLKDFPPLGSLHRPGLTDAQKARWDEAYKQGIAAEGAGAYQQALNQFEEAARIDEHYAELQFRLGRTYFAAGQPGKAKEHFQLARNWDALQFRTDARLNEVIRHVASSWTEKGVVLVDVEKAFADSPLSEQSLPGKGFFNDHVHFNFDGDYLLARTFLPCVASSLGLKATRGNTDGSGVALTRQQCAEGLAFTAWDELNVAAAMTRMTSKPPFLDQLEHDARQAQAEQVVQQRERQFAPDKIEQALAIYRAAIARRPNDWQLHQNLGGFLMDMQKFGPAVQEYRTALKLLPNSRSLMLALGNALLSAGQKTEARAQFEEVLRLDPEYPPAREAVQRIK